jgi:hypothetical protein
MIPLSARLRHLMRKRFRLLMLGSAAMLAGFGSAQFCSAQVGQGVAMTSVTVEVVDPTGASIPKAQVKFAPLQPETPQSRETNLDGKVMLQLHPGDYQLAVTAQGFQLWNKNIEVRAANTRVVRVSLAVGECSPCVEVVAASAAPPSAVGLPTPLPVPGAAEARNLAEQAYTFAYPLVVMEMTRRANTQNGSPRVVNHFVHALAFPDDRFRQVIRPNADTLYSSTWLDLSAEPVLLHVPDTKGRYYLMQLMDAWSETIASPGKRTTGTGEGGFAIVGPGWGKQGKLPDHVQRIDSPTNTVWLIGRTQTNGPSDYYFVHAIQQGYKLSRLSAYPASEPPLALTDLAQLQAGSNAPPPPVQVAHMSADDYFTLVAQLLVKNPPHPEDAAMMHQIAKIGIVPGQPFPAMQLSPEERKAVAEGAQAAADAINKFDRSKLANGKTGWTLPGHYGRYGANYAVRALTARYFLGILPSEDAVYLSAVRDSAGDSFQGSKRYTMHFAKGQTPPVRAFWSLTVYDDQGYFAANSIKRFAIGDRDALKFNADGSLDLYIQHDSPGGDKESNWLPAPSTGFGFNLALRMYWPEPAAISGEWTPPPVVASPGGH